LLVRVGSVRFAAAPRSRPVQDPARASTGIN
jgi:hypothetical protein